MLSTNDILHLENLPAEESLFFITEKVAEGVVFSTSLGQEDQVITDMIFKNQMNIKVFTLDTGRLFYEHYELLSQNNSRYKTKTEVYFPDSEDVEKYVKEKGINAFFHSIENRKEWCSLCLVTLLNSDKKSEKI